MHDEFDLLIGVTSMLLDSCQEIADEKVHGKNYQKWYKIFLDLKWGYISSFTENQKAIELKLLESSLIEWT